MGLFNRDRAYYFLNVGLPAVGRWNRKLDEQGSELGAKLRNSGA